MKLLCEFCDREATTICAGITNANWTLIYVAPTISKNRPILHPACDEHRLYKSDNMYLVPLKTFSSEK